MTSISHIARNLLFMLCLTTLVVACGPEPDDEPVPLAEGVYAELGAPIPVASVDQLEAFDRGRNVALRRFTKEEGLGPDFNVSFCSACHEKPIFGGSSPRYRNFLLVHSRQEDSSVIPVGTNGVQDQFETGGVRKETDPAANHFSTRNGTPFFGIGLLAEVSEASILSYADPDDKDGDGISGRPNYDRGFVGRFGRKAQTVSIEGFIRGPLFNHVGITSNPLSNELKAQLPVPSALPADGLRGMSIGGRYVTIQMAQAAAPDEPTIDDDDAPDPELSEQDLFDLVSFAMLMAAPIPDAPTPESEAGRLLFEQANCDGCHVAGLEGPRGLLPAYTDLLLHDMGEELADGVSMGVASGNEFRTQPLWGVVATGPYLHDGRADTLDDAIRWHGGEAEDSRVAYEDMTQEERDSIIVFLGSLGGRDQVSEGLIPPNDPVPAADTIGGPRAGVDMAQFEAGRRFFDRDIPLSDGLGPRFNGDSCRACHFEPLTGGAGPVDVNVTRHGSVDNGVFTAPAMGTMAHRHQVALDGRPPTDPDANVSEFRQTPPIFGLGLLEQIPDDTVRGLEDPDDMDMDGISGRAHILADGRVGKLGWKANVPDLTEFARDALSNEVGLTVPDRANQAFGFLTDDDAFPDPEISDADFDNLIYYMHWLAAPPRQRTDMALEDQGEQVFAQVGCDGCHVPSLQLADGTPVFAYTDLLLHDVAAPDSMGIADGAATMFEFRTPPLWGLSQTGPYMHHGLASTIDEAILEHQGEGNTSRAAYEALSDADRAALIAFLESL